MSESARSENVPSGASGHRARLRQRLEVEPAALADYEVLELLLGYAVPRRDTKPLAKALLARFGGMRGLMDARQDELVQVPGFGPGLAAFWRVLRETRARYAAAGLRRREELATPEAVARMARARLGGSSHEECWLALVDRRNRLLSWKRLRRGGVADVPVCPRDVLEAALLGRAHGIILVHNHPGGSPAPSPQDRVLTEELQRLAPRMGLAFLDHVIVTEEDAYSVTQSQRL